MDRYRCKLCFREFANGKALGGHVRAHRRSIREEITAPESKGGREENPFQNPDYLPSVRSVSSPSSWERDDSRDSRDRSTCAVFVDPATEISSVLVHDGESETESWNRNQIRHSLFSDSGVGGGGSGSGSATTSDYYKDCYCSSVEPALSSISDTTPDEDGAYCLMMLSRDKWKREEKEFQEKEKKFSNDYPKDSCVMKVKGFKVGGGKYRCKPCNKLSLSYQALGEPRPSHKKLKVVHPSSHVVSIDECADEKVYECPFCDRVFSSGQALGGHKRSHFAANGAISSRKRVIDA